MVGIQLQAHRARQVAQEGAVAARGLQHAATVAPQREHGPHDGIGSEDLAEHRDVAQAQGELRRHDARLACGSGRASRRNAAETGRKVRSGRRKDADMGRDVTKPSPHAVFGVSPPCPLARATRR